MATRDLWHLSFAHLITERAPRGFEVRSEVPLSSEPQRADLLLIRRTSSTAYNAEPGVLRRLWAKLPDYTIVEFKSPVKGFAPGDLLRLASYGAQLHALLHETIDRPRDLALVLVIPNVNAALVRETERMSWRMVLDGDGYGRIDGGVYALHLIATDEVAEAEADDFLRIFSHNNCQTREAAWWWQQWTAEGKNMQSAKDLEGYDEMLEKFLEALTPEERLRGLKPEQRLAGLPPEQRLAGLPPEQVVLALPDDMLRALPQEYLASLPAAVQEAVRKRIGRPS